MSFDPERALHAAKRLRLVEPDASQLLMDVVEERVQAALERADLDSHYDIPEFVRGDLG